MSDHNPLVFACDADTEFFNRRCFQNMGLCFAKKQKSQPSLMNVNASMEFLKREGRWRGYSRKLEM